MIRAFVSSLKQRINASPQFIQVILGPRQDGKTTGVLQLKEELTSYDFAYENAYLLSTLEKFSTNKIQKKGSSPKLIPRANALMGIFEDISRGRKFEVMVGNHLLQKYSHVFYWREGGKEVDFIIKIKNRIIAIEVKSGRKRDGKGLEAFSKLFPAKTLLIDEDNFELIDSLIHAV